MTPTNKRPRAQMRLPQCNKRIRLTRRSLGQWSAQPPELPRIQQELIPLWQYQP